MTRQKTPAPPTRKHLALAAKEQRTRQVLLIGIGLLLVAVVVLVGLGVADEVGSPGKAAVVVNGMSITREELIARTALVRANLVQQRQQAVDMMALFAGSPELRQSLQQQIAQIDAQVNDTAGLASQTIQELIQARLIREEAQRRGIVVSEDDIDQAIAEAFGFFPNGTPTPRPSPTIDATLIAQQTPTEPGPEPTATLIVTAATVEPTATQALTPTVGGSPTPEPSPTAYTREMFDENYRSYVQSAQDSLGVAERYLRDQFADGLYRQRLMEAFTAEVSPMEEQVWAKHLLVPDQTVAETLLDRLRKGELWDELVAQYSEDPSNKDRGGDLGWFGRGVMVAAFEAAAFEGKVGDIVGPVQTQFGWHLIWIVDRAERKLDAAGVSAAADRAFRAWLASALEAATITYDSELFPPTPTSPPTATIEPTP